MKAFITKLKANKKAQWLIWPLWLVICYLAAGYVGGAIILLLAKALGFASVFETTLGVLVFQAVIYVMLLGLIFSLPKVRKSVSRKVLGIDRPMSWTDVGLGIAGYVVYFIVLIAAMMALKQLFPQFDTAQSQDLGFTSLYGVDRYVAFVLFVVIAPLAEEFIMRGFLYGKLRQAAMPKWVAALVVSVLFGIAHGQWNVGVDTFILSMVACYLREVTGTIWPGVIIHMSKNLLAYILLFVVTSM